MKAVFKNDSWGSRVQERERNLDRRQGNEFILPMVHGLDDKP